MPRRNAHRKSLVTQMTDDSASQKASPAKHGHDPGSGHMPFALPRKGRFRLRLGTGRIPTAIGSLAGKVISIASSSFFSRSSGSLSSGPLLTNLLLVRIGIARRHQKDPSILAAMMKSFSCRPLIFFVCSDTVAKPQPKLMSG